MSYSQSNQALAPRKERLAEFFKIPMPILKGMGMPEIFRHSQELYDKMLPKQQQSYSERQDRLLRFEEALHKSRTEPIDRGKGGNQIGSQIDLAGLASDIPVVIVGDLHGEIENFHRILTDSGNLERISKGEAVLLLLGDLIHPDQGDLYQMAHSVQLHEFYMNLKTEYPYHVFSLVGNHDPLNEWTCKNTFVDGAIKKVNQSDVYRDYLHRALEAGGASKADVAAYLKKYALLTELSPFFAVGDGFAAVHAGPIKNLTPDQIRLHKPIDNQTHFEYIRGRSAVSLTQDASQPLVSENRKKVYNQACWSRYKNDSNADPELAYNWKDVESFMLRCGQRNGALICGHTRPRDRDKWYEEIAPGESKDPSILTRHYILAAGRPGQLGYALLQGGFANFRSVV